MPPRPRRVRACLRSSANRMRNGAAATSSASSKNNPRTSHGEGQFPRSRTTSARPPKPSTSEATQARTTAAVSEILPPRARPGLRAPPRTAGATGSTSAGSRARAGSTGRRSSASAGTGLRPNVRRLPPARSSTNSIATSPPLVLRGRRHPTPSRGLRGRGGCVPHDERAWARSAAGARAPQARRGEGGGDGRRHRARAPGDARRRRRAGGRARGVSGPGREVDDERAKELLGKVQTRRTFLFTESSTRHDCLRRSETRSGSGYSRVARPARPRGDLRSRRRGDQEGGRRVLRILR